MVKICPSRLYKDYLPMNDMSDMIETFHILIIVLYSYNNFTQI